MCIDYVTQKYWQESIILKFICIQVRTRFSGRVTEMWQDIENKRAVLARKYHEPDAKITNLI